MTDYRFDDRNIQWNRLDGIDHLQYSVLNVDEKNHIVHVLFKFDANEQIVLHRHLIPNNTFVIQGELRLYDPDGGLKEVRPWATTRFARQGTSIEKAVGRMRTLSSSSICEGTTAFSMKYLTTTSMSSVRSAIRISSVYTKINKPTR